MNLAIFANKWYLLFIRCLDKHLMFVVMHISLLSLTYMFLVTLQKSSYQDCVLAIERQNTSSINPWLEHVFTSASHYAV